MKSSILAVAKPLLQSLLFCSAFSVCLLGQPSSSGVLTNSRIIELVHSGVRPDELARIIALAPQVGFNLTPTGTDELLKAGVPEETIKTMAARENGTAASVQPAPVQPTSRIASPTRETYAQPVANAPNHTSGDLDRETYIERGNKEVGLAGTVFIPHVATGDTSGFASGRFGYYVARNSLVGADFSIVANSGVQLYLPGGFYRYVQHTRNRRFFPFAGAEAAALIGHASGSTQSYFAAKGEAGVKYFVARNVSFETAYNLLYMHVGDAGFKESTASMVVFGFALTF